MANGHTFASRYPLGRMWGEKEITRRRVNQEAASAATISHASQAAIHGGKKGHSLFQAAIKRLTGR